MESCWIFRKVLSSVARKNNCKLSCQDKVLVLTHNSRIFSFFCFFKDVSFTLVQRLVTGEIRKTPRAIRNHEPTNTDLLFHGTKVGLACEHDGIVLSERSNTVHRHIIVTETTKFTCTFEWDKSGQHGFLQ